MVKNSKNTNPQEIDRNDPYWRELVHINSNVERWMKCEMSSEIWKGKRSKFFRDIITHTFKQDGFSDSEIRRRLELRKEQWRQDGAEIDAMERQLSMNYQEKQKEREKERNEWFKADVQDLEISKTLLKLAEWKYVIETTRKKHPDASKFNWFGWVEKNYNKLAEDGYDKGPEIALEEINKSLKQHRNEFDKKHDK